MSKPIPKSLHTVTVLVRLADSYGRADPEGRIERALEFLGYGSAPDDHGLAAAALKVIKSRK